MRVQRLVLGPLETNAWIVDDGQGGPSLVIDPAGDPQVLLEALAGRPVAGIVLTHGHFDHLGAARDLVEATRAPLLVHAADARAMTTPEGSGAVLFGFGDFAPPADRVLEDGDIIVAGELSFEVVHTPGHTPGGICLLGGGHLFSGDTLFAGSVGRTDFAGGSPGDLQQSIVMRLAPLADATMVHPGHGPDTNIGRERRLNPFFPRA